MNTLKTMCDNCSCCPLLEPFAENKSWIPALYFPAIFIVSLYSQPVALAISAWLIWDIFKPETKPLCVEDEYQRDRAKASERQGAVIDVSVYVQGSEEQVSKYFESVMKQVLPALAAYNKAYIANFTSLSYIDPDLWTDILVYTEREKYSLEQDYAYKFLFDSEKKTITAAVKHEYIGGSFLLSLFHCVLLQAQTDVNKLFPVTDVRGLSYLPRLAWDLTTRAAITPLPMVSSSEKIRRYRKEYTIPLNGVYSKKLVTLHNALSALHAGLKLDRPIHAYIPIAFQPRKNIANNIGLVWVTYDPDIDDVSDLAHQLTANRYQAIVTNSLMAYIPRWLLPKKVSSKVRNSVDAVVSFMIGSEEHSDITLRASWTYREPGEYPVYVAIASVKTTGGYAVTETLTISTPTFEADLTKYNEVGLEEW